MRDMKKRHFLQNGGLLLENLISSFKGKSLPFRSFSEKELIQATNNYSSSLIFEISAECKWYKGSLEGRLISVRKFEKELDGTILEMVIKDIATGAQMGVHKNALKLLGCCLETDLPIPVYEFPINGALLGGIRPHGDFPQTHNLTWKNRLSVAGDIANVVSYLHLAFPRPVIHRDVRLANFLLDQDCVPKMCSFILSVPLPEGETHVVDEVRGAIGFIAPEYTTTRTFTEKIDVFAFGVLLLELLTGLRGVVVANWDLDKDILLVDYVREHLNHDGDFNNLVDPNILAEQGVGIQERQQMKKVLGLALYCTLWCAEERPTMMEVAKQLKQIQRGKLAQPEANHGSSISLAMSSTKSKLSLSFDDDGLIQHLSRQTKLFLSYTETDRLWILKLFLQGPPRLANEP